jgi:hypothetical protein
MKIKIYPRRKAKTDSQSGLKKRLWRIPIRFVQANYKRRIQDPTFVNSETLWFQAKLLAIHVNRNFYPDLGTYLAQQVRSLSSMKTKRIRFLSGILVTCADWWAHTYVYNHVYTYVYMCIHMYIIMCFPCKKDKNEKTFLSYKRVTTHVHIYTKSILGTFNYGDGCRNFLKWYLHT